MIQYTFSAVASGVAVMLIDAIGLGPACTISRFPDKALKPLIMTDILKNVAFVLFGGTLTNMTARYGSKMQRWVDHKGREKADETSLEIDQTQPVSRA
jgi:hypothetical protein